MLQERDLQERDLQERDLQERDPWGPNRHRRSLSLVSCDPCVIYVCCDSAAPRPRPPPASAPSPPTPRQAGLTFEGRMGYSGDACKRVVHLVVHAGWGEVLVSMPVARAVLGEVGGED